MLQQIVQASMSLVGGGAFSTEMMKITQSSNALSSAMSHTTMLTRPLAAGLAAVTGALSVGAIASLGSQFENTQNKMAGFFTALGQTNNFADGLQLAETAIRKIEVAAAALPGEAEDYVRVFQQGLPVVQKAAIGTMDDMLKFTNQLTAIGSTFGIDSIQIANDLKRMLQVGKGGAGLDNRTFTEMMPFLQQVEGQANLNTESFNKMTNAARAKVLQDSFKFLEPMITGASKSWDAMQGAIMTTAKTITRLSTAPLFEGMKGGLEALNAAFYDSEGNATALTNNIIDMGRVASTYVVSAVDHMVDGFKWLRTNGVGLFEDIFAFRLGALEQFQQLLSLNAEGPNAQMLSPLQAAFEDVGIEINSTLAAALDPLVQTIDFVSSGLMSLSSAIVPLWDTLQKVVGIYEGVYLTVLPAVGEAFFIMSQAITDVVFGLAHLVSDGIDLVLPHIAVFAQGIADLVIGIGSFMYPAIKIVGEVLMWLGGLVKDYVLPVFNFFVFVLGKAASAVGNFLKAMGNNASEFYGWKREQQPMVQSGDRIADFFGNIMKQIQAERDKREAASGKEGVAANPNIRKTPAVRGGTTVNQDFRFSKFTIDQRFAEGYDPDRIAVLFARDIGRQGTQKLQSGFEPLFALRG